MTKKAAQGQADSARDAAKAVILPTREQWAACCSLALILTVYLPRRVNCSGAPPFSAFAAGTRLPHAHRLCLAVQKKCERDLIWQIHAISNLDIGGKR
ncbi:hypothetical protein [Chimaeribacter arupi]|uniref:hypothetical protein n=1 Tax=Chimaeribacter arupi TaxID=2060066 RepID=UPI0011AF6F50|nr:hypothetical protein [Chimaeribacter arupi]